MKRLTIPCDFGGREAPFHVYVAQPAAGLHPLKYQEAWLREQRGGVVPATFMESLKELLRIAHENDVSFEDLCIYALGCVTEKRE